MQENIALKTDNFESKLILGDCRQELKKMDDEIFQCCVTSPPYWGLRDYGVEGQIGAEVDVNEYISNLVSLFSEVKRTLKKDGTLWLNIGDSYTSGGRKWRQSDKKNPARAMTYRPPTPDGLKSKDLIGIPWKLAFALQADGWFLRSDIVWYKPNCQPESVKDRPTQSHEYLFLLTKSEKYYYDYLTVKEVAANGSLRNRRSVWQINTEAYTGAHFAVFPKALVNPCILAGSKPGDIVLDPFMGSGTVAEVCIDLDRYYVGIEKKGEYIELAKERVYRAQKNIRLL
jgi:site-specific DNA-methyltransferase (adenine-specific)/site-specific DNA-methyltransferase (cytosine-N4-specific)